MNKVFLCHASEDKPVAEQIQLALTTAGYTVFYDEQSLPPSGDFHARIRQTIFECDLFIFLITSSSITPGKFTLSELKFARERWPSPVGRVLPVNLQNLPAARVPAYLTAATLLSVAGNPASEVRAAAEKMLAVTAQKTPRRIAIALAIGSAALAALALIYVFPTKTYSDHKVIPSLDEATKKNMIVRSDQLKLEYGRLLQKETPIKDNGYFTFLLPKYGGITSHPDAKDSGGVFLLDMYEPNLYVTTQVQPIRGINTIDLCGCGIALVVKIKSRALFFWASESDASPNDIRIDIDFKNLNTIALRQVDRQVTEFVNGKPMAEYTFNTKPKSCEPRLFFKSNTDMEGEAYFQGLAVYEFGGRNAFGQPVPKWFF